MGPYDTTENLSKMWGVWFIKPNHENYSSLILALVPAEKYPSRIGRFQAKERYSFTISDEYMAVFRKKMKILRYFRIYGSLIQIIIDISKSICNFLNLCDVEYLINVIEVMQPSKVQPNENKRETYHRLRCKGRKGGGDTEIRKTNR